MAQAPHVAYDPYHAGRSLRSRHPRLVRHQADLLRRVARGERVNEVDWEHVIEEIEDVGLSELNAVQSYLRLMLVHLLKVHCWPESPSVGHWRGEIVSFPGRCRAAVRAVDAPEDQSGEAVSHGSRTSAGRHLR